MALESIHDEKLFLSGVTFKLVFAMLLNWNNSTGILTRMLIAILMKILVPYPIAHNYLVRQKEGVQGGGRER